MATSEVVSDDFLTCNFCYKGLKDPKLLQCFHTFCLECLQEHLEISGANSIFYCPTCNTATKLPKKDASELKPNYFVQRLQGELFKKISEGIECQCCELDTPEKAEYRCINCQEYLCQQCYDAHKITKLTRLHDLVSLGDLQRDKLKGVTHFSPQIKCYKHQLQLIEKYCLNCEKPVCNLCELSEHKNHKFQSFESMAKSQKSRMKSILPSLADRFPVITAALTECDKASKQLVGHTEQTVHEIRKRAAALRNLITSHEKHLLAQVYSSQGKNAEQIKEIQTELTNRKSATITAYQYCDKLVVHGNNVELAMLKLQCNDQLSYLSAQKSSLSPEIVIPIFQHPDDVDKSIGQLLGCIVPHVQMRSPHLVHQTAIHIKPGLEWFRGLAFTDQGDLVIGIASAKDYKNRVHVITSKGREYSFKTGYLAGMALQKDGNVATVDRGQKKIKIFTLQGQLVRTIKCCTIGGLAINNKEQFIIAGNNTIVIYKRNGELDFKIRDKSSGERSLDTIPKHIAVDPFNDNIITTDVADSQLRIRNMHGQFIGSYGEEGKHQGQLNVPEGVCVDQHGHILVADQKNNRIQLLTASGQFRSYLLTEDDGLDSPRVVAVNSDGHIAVGDSAGNIKIFI